MVEQEAESAGVPCDDNEVCRVFRFAEGGGPGGIPAALRLVLADGPIEKGTGFDHLVLATRDVERAAGIVKAAGTEVTLPPTVMFGINITGVRDPDGYSIYLVEEEGFRKSRISKAR